jgi:hypothetical protein
LAITMPAKTIHPAATQNRRIRVFVSSTFRDMMGERDELMTHTWPELHRFCRERQVELVEVDLRWGIAEEQSTRKETLKSASTKSAPAARSSSACSASATALHICPCAKSAILNLALCKMTGYPTLHVSQTTG